MHLTREGLERLKQELERLRTLGRRQAAEAIKDAKSHGDLKENAAYHEAKLNKDRLEMRIQELEKMLLIARVVERPEDADGVAHLGSQVELLDLGFGDIVKITLVGSYEADPAHDRISTTSPLGQAILGKAVGEEVTLEAPGGTQRFRISALG